jgi:DNA-binding transcriptional regulator YbjK
VVTTASTPKGERRRQALVEAAAALLAEGGFDAVRHRAVAERAGLPLASTTYYFGSLDDLVAAAVEHTGRTDLAAGEAELRELGDSRWDLDTVIELVLDQLLGPVNEADDYHEVLLRYERLVGTGRRPYLRGLMRGLGDKLDALLHEIFARSGLRLDRAEVDRLVALVDGTVLNALIEAAPDPRAAARRALANELRLG